MEVLLKTVHPLGRPTSRFLLQASLRKSTSCFNFHSIPSPYLGLEDNGGINVWILLDRLDVAFAEHPDLEANALQGLFRVYLDLMGYEHVKLKIFLRSDIGKG
jgi:hypothetical protein